MAGQFLPVLWRKIIIFSRQVHMESTGGNDCIEETDWMYSRFSCYYTSPNWTQVQNHKKKITIIKTKHMPLPDFNPPVPGSRLRSVTSWRNWRPSKIQTFVNCCRIMVPGEIVRWIRAFTDKNAFSDCYKTAALYNDDCCGRVAELNLTWTQSRAVYHVV